MDGALVDVDAVVRSNLDVTIGSGKMSSITMKQIAEEAGVSIGTVDRVLHNRGRVSKESEERILAVCRKYNYEKNLVGKALYMQRTNHKVGVVAVKESVSPYTRLYLEGLRKIEAEVRDYNIQFLFRYVENGDVSETRKAIAELAEEDICALILKPLVDEALAQDLRDLQEKGVKLVFSTSNLSSVDSFCFVGQNHFKDGRVMANIAHKLIKDPLKVLVITGRVNLESRKEKLEGFLSFLSDNRVDYTVVSKIEAPLAEEEGLKEILDVLKAHPEVNFIYFNTNSNGYVRSVSAYCRPNVVKASFGTREALGPLLKDNCIDFGIEVSAFLHGYNSGDVVFKYLLNGDVPEADSYLARGDILISENI